MTRRLALRCAWILLASVCAGCGGRFDGTVVDDATGRPIAGATVYAYWYVHVFNPMKFLIVDGHTNPPDERCGGDAVTTADADGRYHLDLPVPVGTGLHDAHLLVVAPDYYDPRGRRQWSGDRNTLDPLVATLQWSDPRDFRETPTLKMHSLAGVPIDARLLALRLAGPTGGCPYESFLGRERNQQAFGQARDDTLRRALCEQPPDAPDLPRADLFRLLFASRDPAWIDTVDPLLPKQGDLPVPAAAWRNACAVLHPASNPTAGSDAEKITMHGSLLVDGDGASNADVPVRIFWGIKPERRTNARGQDVDGSLPLRGFFATTDAQGGFDFAVEKTMLDDQADEASRQSHYFWVAVPLSGDLISFDNRLGAYRGGSIDGNSLTREIDYLSSDSRAFGGRVVHGDSFGGKAGGAIASGPTRLVSNAAPEPEAPTSSPLQTEGTYRDLGAIWAKAAHQYSGPRQRPWEMTVYPFAWSGAALLWRTDGLLALAPEVEDDPAAFERVVADQIADTFEHLCARPDVSLSPAESLRAAKLIWWNDVRQEDVEAASNAARTRVRDWHAGLCGTPIKVATICAEWQRSKVSTDARYPAPPNLADYPHETESQCPAN